MQLRHRHILRPVAVCDGTAIVPLQMLVGRMPRTVILFRCDDPHGPACFDTKLVDGTWDLHDVAAMPSNWPAEITRDDMEPQDSTISKAAWHEQTGHETREAPSDPAGTAGAGTADQGHH